MTQQILRPMLAATCPPRIRQEQYRETYIYQRFPWIATPKVDGIRCLKVKGEFVSRRLKPIPNKQIVDTLHQLNLPDGVDGELITYKEVNGVVVYDPYSTVQSLVMSENTVLSAFRYCIFDAYSDAIYTARLQRIETEIPKLMLPYQTINTLDYLVYYEQKMLAQGYEGIILRQPNSPYKFGRSTLKEGYMLKLKNFLDSEAIIVGFYELQHNCNSLGEDELGFAKRTSELYGMEGGNTLGGIEVVDCKSKVKFCIGTGFSNYERQRIWDNKNLFLGKMVKYKYQPVGVKDKPRSPVFLGFRNTIDV